MDVVVVALGNPGLEYAATRHNIAWRVADELAARWGRLDAWRPVGPALAAGTADDVGRAYVVKPQAYMNRSGLAFAAWLERYPQLRLELDPRGGSKARAEEVAAPSPEEPPDERWFRSLWRRVSRCLASAPAGGRYQPKPPDDEWRLAPGEVATASLLVIADDVALPLGALRLRGDGSSGGHNGLADVERALGTSAYARLRVGVGGPPPGVPMTEWVLGAFSADEEARLPTVVRAAADAAETWRREGLGAAQTRFNGKRLE